MILSLYRTATQIAGPLIEVYLSRRKARGKEDPARFGERRGIAGMPRPDGPLVWMHAASVGESITLLPLIERLTEAGHNVLITTGTVTSAALMAKRLPANAVHQYVPVDRPVWVKRFLDHWSPDAAIWAESEFWPNLMAETAERNIAMILVNGRMSARSFKSWQRFPAAIGQLLGYFALCLAQTETDAQRLRKSGARRVEAPGNLKYAVPPLPADPKLLAQLEEQLGTRPRWVAASTHAGEEQICGQVHRRLAARHRDLLSIIVPRHPERGAQIAQDLRHMGLTVAQRSADEPVNTQTQIYLADTMGELGLFYRVCPVVFIGKSLIPQGGQNPLEPARLGCAVLHGPHMGNFSDIIAHLDQSGGAMRVADEADLARGVTELIDNDDERQRRSALARDAAETEAGVLDKVMRALTPLLPKAPS